MTVGFNRKWIFSAAIFLILLICCIIGIYTLLTRDILVEGGKMGSTEKNFFIGAFFCIGTAAGAALIKLVSRIMSKRGCFTVDENGISDTVVMFNIFTLYFVFNINNIPWSAVKSVEKDEFDRTVRAVINKERINEITASPAAKLVLKYCGYFFGHGFADINSDETVRICNQYMGKRCE